jgi:hypothetical protein
MESYAYLVRNNSQDSPFVAIFVSLYSGQTTKVGPYALTAAETASSSQAVAKKIFSTTAR